MARIAELEAPKQRPPDLPEKPKTAPVFLTQLKDLGDIYEGQSAHMEANVQPIDATITWLHNGQHVSAGTLEK